MLNRNSIEYELDMVLENIHVTHYKIELDIEVQGQDGAFEVAIAANDDLIYNGCLKDGKHTLHKELTVPPKSELRLTAETSSHRHGQKAVIAGFRLNGVDIPKHNLWVMDSQLFKHVDGKEEKTNGVYYNGTWSITLPTPVFPWMKAEQVKRSKVKYDEHLDFGIEGEEYYTLLDRIFR